MKIIRKSKMRYVLTLDQAEEFFQKGIDGFYVYHHTLEEMSLLFNLKDRYGYLLLSTCYWNVSQFIKKHN